MTTEVRLNVKLYLHRMFHLDHFNYSCRALDLFVWAARRWRRLVYKWNRGLKYKYSGGDSLLLELRREVLFRDCDSNDKVRTNPYSYTFLMLLFRKHSKFMRWQTLKFLFLIVEIKTAERLVMGHWVNHSTNIIIILEQ